MADTNGESNKRENEEDGEQSAKAPRRNRWDTPASSTAAEAPGASSLANLSSIQAGAAAAKELARDALAKAQRAAEIQQAVNAKMGSLVGSLPGGQTPARPAVQTVRLDAQGRLLDEQGKVIQSTARQQSSLMVNSNQRASASVDSLMETPPDISTNKYYDPRMKLPGEGREKRKARAFNFVAEGSWSRKGDDLRETAAIEQMVAEAKGKSKSSSKSLVGKDDHSLPMLWGGQGEGGASSSGDGKTAVAVSASTLKQKLAAVPAVEWWDAPLLRGASYTAAPGNTLEANMMLEIVTHYVEHPIPVEPPAEPAPPAPQPLPLTKRERRKRARQEELGLGTSSSIRAASKRRRQQGRDDAAAHQALGERASSVPDLTEDELKEDAEPTTPATVPTPAGPSHPDAQPPKSSAEALEALLTSIKCPLCSKAVFTSNGMATHLRDKSDAVHRTWRAQNAECLLQLAEAAKVHSQTPAQRAAEAKQQKNIYVPPPLRGLAKEVDGLRAQLAEEKQARQRAEQAQEEMRAAKRALLAQSEREAAAVAWRDTAGAADAMEVVDGDGFMARFLAFRQARS